MISSLDVEAAIFRVLGTRLLLGLILSVTALLFLDSPFQTLLAAVAALALFVLTLRDLSFGVLALLASVPIQTSIVVSAGGREVTATKIVVFVVATAWLARILVGVSRPYFDRVAFAIAAYVVILALSIIEARDIGAWSEETYRWAVTLMAYVAAHEAFVSARSVNRVLWVISYCVIATSAVGLWQVATGAGPSTFHVEGLTRAYATFGEPNPFAGYLEMSVPLLIAFVLGAIIENRTEWRDVFRERHLVSTVSLAVCVGSVTLALTQSRGGYAGFATAVAVIVWLTGGKVRWLGTVAAGIGLAALLVSPYGSRITDRFDSSALGSGNAQVTTQNFAARERSAHWQAAINMAKMSPILGIGAGNLDNRYRESTSIWRFRIPRGHAHNAYLQSLAQAGVFGLVSYLAILAFAIAAISRAYRVATTLTQRSIAIGVAAVTVAVAVHNAVDYLHVLSLGIQLAIVWAVVNYERDTQNTSPRPAFAS